MKIPTFQEAEAACERGNPTALDTFVQSWEPAGNEDGAEFREQLQKVVEEASAPLAGMLESYRLCEEQFEKAGANIALGNLRGFFITEIPKVEALLGLK